MTESGPRIEFDEVQIGIGVKPLAQHGFVIIENGTLFLLGTQRQPIDSAPLALVTAAKMPFTMGRTLRVTVNGTKYTVTPSWGRYLGVPSAGLLAKDGRSASKLLLQVIERGDTEPV